MSNDVSKKKDLYNIICILWALLLFDIFRFISINREIDEIGKNMKISIVLSKITKHYIN